jgi:hypothetical protein
MSLAEYLASQRNEAMLRIRSMIIQYVDEIEARARMVSCSLSVPANSQSSDCKNTPTAPVYQNTKKSREIEQRTQNLGKNLMMLGQNLETIFAFIELEMFPQTIGNRIRQLVLDLLKPQRA